MDAPPAFFASPTPAADGILGFAIGSSPETRKKGERMHAINRLAEREVTAETFTWQRLPPDIPLPVEMDHGMNAQW